MPSRSDTVLVTSYGYNAAGWTESVTDPAGIVGKTYYDNLGRTTKTIENYVDGTPSDADDKTTEYTYDGSGHMLTLKADLTSGHQTTQWVYGASAGAGDDITSNDISEANRLARSIDRQSEQQREGRADSQRAGADEDQHGPQRQRAHAQL